MKETSPITLEKDIETTPPVISHVEEQQGNVKTYSIYYFPVLAPRVRQINALAGNQSKQRHSHRHWGSASCSPQRDRDHAGTGRRHHRA